MTLQEILFIVSVVFFVLAAICIILAVVVFFTRNIPDVQADLSGKKRAAGVAEMAAKRPGRDRRKGVARVEPTSGRLSEPSPLDNPLNQVPHVESVVSTPTPAPVVSQPQPVVSEPVRTFQPQPQPQPAAMAEQASDDSVTTILPDDDQSTTILPAAAPAGETPVASAPVEAPAKAAAEPVSDDAATTILPSDDAATSILPPDDAATTILSDEQATTAAQPSAVTPVTPEGFEIVRKIVLRESENVITVG